MGYEGGWPAQASETRQTKPVRVLAWTRLLNGWWVCVYGRRAETEPDDCPWVYCVVVNVAFHRLYHRLGRSPQAPGSVLWRCACLHPGGAQGTFGGLALAKLRDKMQDAGIHLPQQHVLQGPAAAVGGSATSLFMCSRALDITASLLHLPPTAPPGSLFTVPATQHTPPKHPHPHLRVSINSDNATKCTQGPRANSPSTLRAAMSLSATYAAFLASPSPGALADNASLHYITTLTTINDAPAIVKHFTVQEKLLKQKEHKLLSAIESTDGSLCVDLQVTIEFVQGGGAYLPGLDDNFVSDRTVTFPMVGGGQPDLGLGALSIALGSTVEAHSIASTWLTRTIGPHCQLRSGEDHPDPQILGPRLASQADRGHWRARAQLAHS